MHISYNSIGLIHSPFKEAKGTPIQPAASPDTKGTIELFKEYSLKKLNIIYYLLKE